jgi:hypothetical protein
MSRSFFGTFKKTEVSVVAPDGTVRGRHQAIITPAQFTIPDASAVIFVGDELRRLLPNGVEEAFEVVEPTFNDVMSDMPAFYAVKVRRKGTFQPGTGGNYTFHVTGPNARVNIGSTDGSQNVVGDHAVFRDLQHAVRAAALPEGDRASLEEAIRSMRASAGTDEFKSAYQRFVEVAAAHITIVAPFLPALTHLL